MRRRCVLQTQEDDILWARMFPRVFASAPACVCAGMTERAIRKSLCCAFVRALFRTQRRTIGASVDALCGCRRVRHCCFLVAHPVAACSFIRTHSSAVGRTHGACSVIAACVHFVAACPCVCAVTLHISQTAPSAVSCVSLRVGRGKERENNDRPRRSVSKKIFAHGRDSSSTMYE